MAFEPGGRRAQPRTGVMNLVRMQQDDGQFLLRLISAGGGEAWPDPCWSINRVSMVVAELAAARACSSASHLADTTMDTDWWRIESLMRAHPGVRRAADRGITENVAIQDIDDVSRLRYALKNSAANRDRRFRRRYTSFRIAQLGVDIVKSDGAFVQNIARSADNAPSCRR